MARSEPALDPSRNCWRIERADRAAVIVDADDYFLHARAAMMDARHQLLLVGWDFDGRIRLVDDNLDRAPATVGKFIEWLVRRRPSLSVHILRWDTGAIKSLFRGTTILTLIRWMADRRIHVKLDGHHPVAASHHQKILVVDDCLAFCGGIDMTDDRWDTRAHADDEPRRIEPSGKPYKPWHDATTALSGPVAKALGELARSRWHTAGGGDLPVPAHADACWPDDLPAPFRDCEVAISRTMPAMPGTDAVHEIEALYLDLIARAERWIYAESQYFASHKIARAIAARLAEPDGPEIVVINPVTAEGWLQPIAMDNVRAQLVRALRRHDRHGRLRLYHPLTRGGEPIYVHAKVLVVDGEILRVGSSNFNNRSMRLDSECDVTIDATRPANAHVRDAIAHVAFDLIAEHLDTDTATIAGRFAETGSLIATIESPADPGKRRLIPYELPDLNAAEETLADSKLLDPEDPDHMMEAMSADLLRRGLRRIEPASLARPAAVAGSLAIAAGVFMAWRRRKN